MTEDVDWARDLFDRTRGAGEPGWAADPVVLARAGDRRRRFRMAGAGGGLAGVVALTAAVAVGLGAGTADLGSQPGPGGAWGNRPLSDVFKYVTNMSGVDRSGQTYVPQSAAVDLAAVVGQVDPSFTHLVQSHSGTHGARIVAADDARAKRANAIAMGAVWANDTLRQSGELSIELASSSGWAQTGGTMTGFSTDSLAAPCNAGFAKISTTPGAPTGFNLPAQWSACTVTHFSDGSIIGSASARIGTGTASVAVRQFTDGELFSIAAQDFQSPLQGTVPDPATVVQPTPWTAQSLAAALADPAIRSGWSPLSPPNADGKLLQPSDLGNDWSYDTGRADPGVTGDFVATGCSAEMHLPLAEPGTDAYYRGPLPNGVSGTAYEGEFDLEHGAGAQAMAKVRLPFQGGCKDWPANTSKDTVMPLPAGIGDEAFAVSQPEVGTVGIYVRVGDTVLQTDLSDGYLNPANSSNPANPANSDSQTDLNSPINPTNSANSPTGQTSLDLSTAADQQWLAGVARSMVARHSGGATHH